MDEKVKLSIELLGSILKSSEFELTTIQKSDLIINIRDIYYQPEIKNGSFSVEELLKLIYNDIDKFIVWDEEVKKKNLEVKQGIEDLGKIIDKLNK